MRASKRLCVTTSAATPNRRLACFMKPQSAPWVTIWVTPASSLKKQQAPQRHKPERGKGMQREALVGVEPTMADLQSAALATWLQRLKVLLLVSLRCGL